MADALADLLREIENMRKERGKLRTKNAALEAELAEEKARSKKLLWQIGEQAHASVDQTELHNRAITSLTALREAVGGLFWFYEVYRFGKEAMNLSDNAFEEYTLTMYFATKEAGDLATRLEASALIKREKNDNRRV